MCSGPKQGDNSWLQFNGFIQANRGTASPTQPQSVRGNYSPTNALKPRILTYINYSSTVSHYIYSQVLASIIHPRTSLITFHIIHIPFPYYKYVHSCQERRLDWLCGNPAFPTPAEPCTGFSVRFTGFKNDCPGAILTSSSRSSSQNHWISDNFTDSKVAICSCPQSEQNQCRNSLVVLLFFPDKPEECWPGKQCPSIWWTPVLIINVFCFISLSNPLGWYWCCSLQIVIRAWGKQIMSYHECQLKVDLLVRQT